MSLRPLPLLRGAGTCMRMPCTCPCGSSSGTSVSVGRCACITCMSTICARAASAITRDPIASMRGGARGRTHVAPREAGERGTAAHRQELDGAPMPSALGGTIAGVGDWPMPLVTAGTDPYPWKPAITP